jgi:hypothetical protein
MMRRALQLLSIVVGVTLGFVVPLAPKRSNSSEQSAAQRNEQHANGTQIATSFAQSSYI